MNEKRMEKFLFPILIKLGQVFKSCIIFKTGHVITCDGRPFMVCLTEPQVEIFNEFLEEPFQILQIKDIRLFKKSLVYKTEEWKSLYTVKFVEEKERKGVPEPDKFIVEMSKREVQEKINHINMINMWNRFRLSENDEINMQLVTKLFKDNQDIEFYPTSLGEKQIILTKSVLPLVSEKNCGLLYYAEKSLQDNLSILVFDFRFDMFEIYSFLYFIPIVLPERKDVTNDG